MNKKVRLILRTCSGDMEGKTIATEYFTREVIVPEWPYVPRGSMTTEPEVIGAEMLDEAAGEGEDAPPTPISYAAQTELGKRLVDLRNKAAGGEG